jgi:hypothetical protein
MMFYIHAGGENNHDWDENNYVKQSPGKHITFEFDLILRMGTRVRRLH